MPEENYFLEKYGDDIVPIGQQPPASSADSSNYFLNKYGDDIVPYAAPQIASDDEDPLWSDYGKMVVSGGIQLGSGVGWLFNNFDWGKSLQEGSADLARSFMEDLSPQATEALQVEFTKRDNGQLWTNKKWSKAKLIAAQSLLGTAAGMGAGSILTRGLAAAGMTKAATTAAGATIQVPTKTAGAIGYGLGEAGVAAPTSAASVEAEIMAMSHEDLYENAADYRAAYEAMEGTDEDRQRRAKEMLAKAAAGDTFARNMMSTFILSAPLGVLVGGYAGKVAIASTRPRSIATGALGEAGQEFLQSGAEKMGENVAMRRVDPDRPLMEGALEEAVGGAMAGGMMGAVPGTFAPLEAPAGPALSDAESPLASLDGTSTPMAETDIDPTTGKPVLRAEPDELDAALDSVLNESSQLPDKDELDDALEGAYNELGISTATSEAAAVEAAAEQAFADELVAGEKAEEDRLAAEDAQLDAAKKDIEKQVVDTAARVAERKSIEETELQAEKKKERDTVFAQAEKLEAKEQARVEKETDKGFAELEQQNRDEYYAQQLAEGEAGGVGVNRAQGEMLGEKIQAAQQKAGVEVTPMSIRKGVPAPEVEYIDKRLTDPVRRDQLSGLKEELTVGGGSTLIPDTDGGRIDPADATAFEGRTSSTNPAWFQDAAAAGEIPSVRWFWNAVDKALAGKRLGVKQRRAVQNALDNIEAEEAEGQAEYEREQDPMNIRKATGKRKQGKVEKSTPARMTSKEYETSVVGQTVTGINTDSLAATNAGIVRAMQIVEAGREALAGQSMIALRAIRIKIGARTSGNKKELIKNIWNEAFATDRRVQISQKRKSVKKAKPATTPVPDFELTQEQDGVVPEKPKAAPKQPRKEVSADIGVPGDIFSEDANKQIDLVDETRKKAAEETGGLVLREQKPSELKALADETEALITKFNKKGDTTGFDRTEILLGIQKLKQHKDSRADKLAEMMGVSEEEEQTENWAEIGKKDGMAGVAGDSLTEARPISRVKEEQYWKGVLAGAEDIGNTQTAVAARRSIQELNKPIEGEAVEVAPTQLEAPDTDTNFVIDEKKFDEMGPDTEERVFSSTVAKNRKGIDIKLKNKGDEYISMEEADKRVTEWEDHAIAQRDQRDEGGPQDHKDNFNRVILSLFDTTGTWANPYALAGYDVRVIDIKNGVDVQDFSSEYMEELFNSFGGKDVYGILAACPCTTYSNSGTRWRKDRHDNADPVESRKIIEEMWGKKAADAKNDDGSPMYATANDYSNELVAQTMRTLEYYRPQFWALENPEGRIETSAGLPGKWRTGFQPHNFGEPYTKRTLLWGEFDENLPTANVEPTEGSKMHKMPPSEGRAAARAETPMGFSYAFFMANNYLDTDPVERTKKDYWYVAGAVEEAFRAGVTEDQIRDTIEPDSDYEGSERESALEALRELIAKAPGKPTPSPATPTMSLGELQKLSDPNVPIGKMEEQESRYLDNLERQIRKEGIKAPITITTRNGKPLIVRDGMHRIAVMRRLGLKEAPVKFIDEEAALEREAIQNEPALDDESEDVGEIPGWDDIEAEAATSPKSDVPYPSEAQIEAYNFRKAHIKIKGMSISIENPSNDTSRGGTQHYGQFDDIEGADGDKLDVFVNPKIQTDYNNKVYIIDQMEQKSGQFDEHKVMLGYTNQLAAVKAYKNSYDKVQKVGPVTAMDMATFKKWTESRAKLTRPVSEDAFFGEQSRMSGRASKGKTQDLKQVGRQYRFRVGSSSFNKWFGKSKIVDKSGKPLMVYHGTKEDFDIFKSSAELGKLTRGYGNNGIYFTPSASLSSVYARQSGSVMPVYLSIQNPKIIKADSWWQKRKTKRARAKGIFGHSENALRTSYITDEELAEYKAAGYDGIVNESMEEIVVFDASQVKSAVGNRGTYDISNQDIRFSKQLQLFGKGMINSPNQKYINAVLTAKSATTHPQQQGPKDRGPIMPEDVQSTTEAMNKAVTQLIETTQAREALDAELGIEGEYTRQNVEKDTQMLRESMPGANITILTNYKAGPARLVAAIENDNMESIGGVTDVDTGYIYIFADQVINAEDATRLILHEAFHSGARVAFGDQLDPLLEDLYKNVPDKFKTGLQEIIDKYKFDVSNRTDRLEAAEELLAHIAEKDPKNSVLQEFIAKIRQFLRGMGVEMGQWTDEEIISVIKEASGAVGRRSDRIAGVTFDEDVVVEETGEVFTIEQDAEAVVMHIQKRKSMVEKVRACL